MPSRQQKSANNGSERYSKVPNKRGGSNKQGGGGGWKFVENIISGRVGISGGVGKWLIGYLSA